MHPLSTRGLRRGDRDLVALERQVGVTGSVVIHADSVAAAAATSERVQNSIRRSSV
jgi:hypothetical protein